MRSSRTFWRATRCYSLCLWGETVYKDLMLGTPKPLEGLQGLLLLPQGALNASAYISKPPCILEYKRAKRVLYSNRSRYSRGDRGEGGIHGWLGGQDLEVPMIFIVSFGRVHKGSSTCMVCGVGKSKTSARRSKVALLCC